MEPKEAFNLLACERETVTMAMIKKKHRTSILTKSWKSIFPAFMQ